MFRRNAFFKNNKEDKTIAWWALFFVHICSSVFLLSLTKAFHRNVGLFFTSEFTYCCLTLVNSLLLLSNTDHTRPIEAKGENWCPAEWREELQKVRHFAWMKAAGEKALVSCSLAQRPLCALKTNLTLSERGFESRFINIISPSPGHLCFLYRPY